ncbi:MAG: T9SS type A sorting domain-containing protein [Flavobacteriales bacterium]|nr:T9SS type A sorting domain-containing protein [Flavobacteriales bacterium]
MKNLLTTLFFLATLSLAAQITVTSSNFPVVGDDVIIDVDTLASSYSIGNSGANQTYSFLLTTAHETDTLIFQNPSSTPYSSDFPNSNLALEDAGAYAYFDANVNSAALVGGVQEDPINGTPIAVEISPSETIANFPTNYQDVWMDTSGFDFTVFVGQFGFDSARVKNDKYKEVLIDSWGQVTTDYGTFNCLRQKVNITEYDSVWGYSSFTGSWSLFSAETSGDTLYDWLSNDPQANFPIITADVDGNGNIVELSVLRMPLTVNIESPKLDEAITIFPNPSNGRINVSGLDQNEVYNYKLFSIDGKIIESSQFVNNIAMDLITGTYLLRLENEAGDIIVQKRIVID